MRQRITLGTDVMKEARKRLGFSYEAMGRQLNVSSKTYERWEKSGAVPVTDLERVARVLELEIQRPPSLRVEIAEEQASTDLGLLRKRVDELSEQINELFEEVFRRLPRQGG